MPECRAPAIVLLGASNLTRGISTVVETLQLAHAPRLRILAALGYGRSFGMRSSVLGRGLPSILDCGLWQALAGAAGGSEGGGGGAGESESAAPIFALITDIGNDVMYEAAPRQIVEWVAMCVDRLAAAGVPRIHITALPIESICRVRPWQYAIVRAVLFPRHHLTFEQAVSRALETQHLLERYTRESPQAPRIRLLAHEGAWYGFDPIHIRRGHWAAAWAAFLLGGAAPGDPEGGHGHHHGDADVADHAGSTRATGSFDRWRRLRLHLPAEYDILGLPRRHRQPLTLPDGTTVEMH